MSKRLEDVSESLLRAGIAPRHVKRYVRELSDHFEDLLREEIANGIPATDAEMAARRRLGSNEVLAGAMLKRSELLSITARFPALVFGTCPVLTLIGLIFFGVVFEKQFLTAHLALTHWLNPAAGPLIAPPNWLKVSFYSLDWAINYAAPLVIAAAMYVLGRRQRMAMHWIMIGGVIICIVGGCHYVGVRWSTLQHHSELFVGFLGPGYTRAEIWACIMRVAANLSLLCAAYWVWFRPIDRARRGSRTIDPAHGTDLA